MAEMNLNMKEDQAKKLRKNKLLPICYEKWEKSNDMILRKATDIDLKKLLISISFLIIRHPCSTIYIHVHSIILSSHSFLSSLGLLPGFSRYLLIFLLKGLDNIHNCSFYYPQLYSNLIKTSRFPSLSTFP